MDILSALILGLIQGLTEFLPVSSSGHLVLMQHFLGFREPQLAFDVLVHVATLLAVVIYFRKDIGGMALSILPRSKDREGRRWVLMIAVGTFPTALIGLAFEEQFIMLFASPRIVAIMLCFTAVFLLLSDRMPVRTGSQVVKLSWIRAIGVGIAQGLAIIPGISRSGFTIAMAIFSGIDPARAARFSFLLSIPAILGATLLQIADIVTVEPDHIPAYFVAFIAAFASGYLAIDLLIKTVIKRKLWKFSIYLGVVGLFALIFV